MFFQSVKTVKSARRGSGHLYTFDTFDTLEKHSFSPDGPPLLLSTDRIREARQKFHPADDLQAVEENLEMHDSALFDLVVEVDFYDGRRLRVPQSSTPEGWTPKF